MKLTERSYGFKCIDAFQKDYAIEYLVSLGFQNTDMLLPSGERVQKYMYVVFLPNDSNTMRGTGNIGLWEREAPEIVTWQEFIKMCKEYEEEQKEKEEGVSK